MAEGSRGRDIQPSHGAFRAVDRVDSNNPRVQQARRVTSSADHKPGISKKIRNIAMALGIATGAVGGGSLVLNEMSKPPKETFQTHHGILKQIDMGKYLVQIHVEGEPDLNVRTEPVTPTYDEQNEHEDRNNIIKMDDVVSINGTAWDGKSPIVIENSPIAMSEDPTNGILQAPWFAVELGKKSLLGDVTTTVGFISHSQVTDAHITRLDDEGGIANARFEDGHIKGVNEYGDTVLPTEKVGLATVPSDLVITHVGNPQS